MGAQTIAEFLAARYAEAWAAERDRELQSKLGPGPGTRAVDGLRAILERYADCKIREEDDEYSVAAAMMQSREYDDFVLPNLAVAFSDHPDYDQSWRP